MRRWKLQELDQITAELEQFRTDSQPDEERLPREIQELLDCIHEHLFDPGLSVKTLKALCGIRDNNISSHFRWRMGKTIKDYIDSLRLEAACRLLETSECGVFDVSLSVGYEHPQTFYRVFDRTFDCTPAEYRRRSREPETAASSAAR